MLHSPSRRPPDLTRPLPFRSSSLSADLPSNLKNRHNTTCLAFATTIVAIIKRCFRCFILVYRILRCFLQECSLFVISVELAQCCNSLLEQRNGLSIVL